MRRDDQVPALLKKTQQWFGGIIRCPLDLQNKIQSTTPAGNSIEVEACDFIKPSPTLQPAERIQIYNQQYWWRLLSALHDILPLVVRLFGPHEFNQKIGIPYLLKYPSKHWSLTFLATRLVRWVNEEYQGTDKKLIKNAILLDTAFNDSFVAKYCEPILMENLPVPNDPSSLMEKTVYLQDHLYLFALECDLFDFRVELLKQKPEHWLEHDFPKLKKERNYYYVLYRNQWNLIDWKEISKAEFFFLQRFYTGSTVESACEWLETQEDEIQNDAFNNLQKWFQGWIILRWLTLNK